eukprot:CAMPEP_0169307736 /NCGR_PEP_ID=MMETSP1017-20121227/1467_1 /TAXON_ID=342587 /ORGANISM="Karlodinium micrum, Strain CCMP2283" /LENGTH=228 /DNA_ID=CAMNT_0009401075 /DNA_START=74 /DNA_END=760 /DNA_ORIENTATION=-
MAKSGWETMLEQPGDKKFAAHNERNQLPILEKLQAYLPECASPPAEGSRPLDVLEVASGTGQHAAFLATRLHNVIWQPTDYDPVCIKSTDLWTDDLRNIVKPASVLDVTCEASSLPFPASSFDIIYNCNMIHLAPIQVLHGFCACVGVLSRPGAKLFIYGPFKVGGEHVSESNAEFDRKLRERDESWGIRGVEEVQSQMAKHEFAFLAKEEMPNNNFLLVFEKAAAKS